MIVGQNKNNDTLPSIVTITEPYSSSSDITIIWNKFRFLNRKEFHMVGDLNLTFLKFTNQGHYFGHFDFPEATCKLDICPIDYLALYGEKVDSQYKFPCLCFYQYDSEFDGLKGLFNAIYYDDKRLLSKCKDRLEPYHYVISPDYSICSDVPQIENLYRIFKSRIVGSYLVNELGKIVIPNISFVDETTKEVALSGIAKGSAVAISSKGLLKGKDKQYLLDYIVDKTLKEIQPNIVILYNVSVKSSKLEEIVTKIKNVGVKVRIPPNKLLIRNQILEAI